MTIGIIYTSTTPELTGMIEEHMAMELPGVTILSYQKPEILADTIVHHRLTAHGSRMLMNQYEEAVRNGAQVLLSVCSSVGDLAKLAKPLYEFMGVGFVRIDEDMALSAVRQYRRLGVIATLPTTMEPTCRLIANCARTAGRDVVIVEALAEGGYGLDRARFIDLLTQTGRKVLGEVDALIFAQGSMAYAARQVSETLGVPVFSSVEYGVRAVAREVRKRQAEAVVS